MLSGFNDIMSFIMSTMIEVSNNSCGCLTVLVDSDAAEIEILAAIRADCPALQLFLPDDIWPKFKAWHAKRDVVAKHRSILLYALKYGYLARLTGPIHRYLIENGALRQGVKREYLRALRETWMFYSDALERHRKH